MALEVLRCLKCEGHGIVVLEHWEKDGYCGSYMRPWQPGDGTKRWYTCQTCNGAGVLEEYTPVDWDWAFKGDPRYKPAVTLVETEK
jgi:DnaJ-class molecular chaperone